MMKQPQEEKQQAGAMYKLASFIVDKRSLFFLITIIALVFSCFSRNWVEVENDLAAFLPEDSETRQGLDVMEEEFTTYGSARVMVANITLPQARALADELAGLRGVQSVTFDDSGEHYNNVSGLYDVTFAYSEDDDACLEALARVEED